MQADFQAFFDHFSKRRNLENLILVEAKLRFLHFSRLCKQLQLRSENGAKNEAKNHQKSTPRGFQVPLGTHVWFSSPLKLDFKRFWPPTWPQHGLQNRSKKRSKIDLAAQRPPRSLKGRIFDPKLSPFWTILGTNLASTSAQINFVALGPSRRLKESISGPTRAYFAPGDVPRETLRAASARK